METKCTFTQCIRCHNFWHECKEETTETPEDFYINVCCLYCDSCQIEECCPTYVSRYRHECLEWDGLVIDPNDPEMDCCLCYNDTVSWLG